MSRLPGRLLTLARAVLRAPGRRPPPEPSQVRRVLVAHNLLLGDTLMLAPLLARIAAVYPQAERVVLARPSVVPLFSGRPYGFEALAYDPQDTGALRVLFARGPFDLAYVLGDNRYAWLARAAGARWIVGFAGDRPAWKNWMVDIEQPWPTRPAAWADMAAGLVDGNLPPPYRPGDWPAPRLDEPFEPTAVNYAVLHVGASTPLKHWPAERWSALAVLLAARGIAPVWSCGPGEESLLEAIDPVRQFERRCGTLSLPQLWALLAGARLLVCPDTGVAHLGKLTGTPTLTLFGPGSAFIYGSGKFWGGAPYRALAREPYPCRDQRRLFRREIDWVRRCGRSVEGCRTPGACMAAISLEEVEQGVDQLLGARADEAGRAR